MVAGAVIGWLTSGGAYNAAWAQSNPALVSNAQLPTSGQVSAGQASISQSGNTLNVNQTSQRAIVDWNSFNVGKDATVNFQQPNAQSSTLNRVADTQPSQILGRITAPGQVVLVNPQGVYFGKSSSVDVGGLVATTHAAGSDEYLKGQLKFNRNGAKGAVINEGELRAALGGYIALLAPEVRNQGLIVANLGTVALAAGEAYELQFDGQGALSNVRVTPATLNTLVENKQAIQAPGGLVILSAQAASRLQTAVVSNAGRIEATGLVNRAGRIVLEATTKVLNSGLLSVNAGADASPAGTVHIQAPVIENSGTISASNLAGGNASGNSTVANLGRISIEAEQFTQTASGVLDVSAVNTSAGQVTLQVSDSIYFSGSVLAASTMGSGQSANYVLGNAVGGQINVQATRRIDFDGVVLDASGPDGAGRVHVNATGTPADTGNNTQPVRGLVALANNTIIRVNSPRAQAGRVEVEGDDISLDTATLIEAKGATQGGTVLIGGDWQGSGTLRQATTVRMSADSTIDVSATDNGDGGKVVLWSDVHVTNSVTTVNGVIYAQGGANAGAGGQVETSGHQLQVHGIRVNTSAADGSAGSWLLDPFHMVINANGTDYSASTASGTTTYVSNGQSVNSSSNSYIAASTLQTALASNNVTVQSSLGYDIISQGDGALTYSGGTARTLTLNSGRNITLAYDNATYPGGISGANLSLVLQATSGTVSNAATINVGGGVTVNSTGFSGAGAISLGSNQALSISQSGTSIYTGVISGAGATLTKLGTGSLALTNANTYSGGTTLSAGTLGLYNNTAAGTGALTAADGSTLMFGRNVTTFANNITLNGSVTFGLDSTVDYLLVGGGGGGGGDGGAGGGGGGIRNITGADVKTSTTFAVTVGAGGNAGAWGVNNGGAGSNSSLTIGATTYTVNGGSGGVTSPAAGTASGGVGTDATATGGYGGTGANGGAGTVGTAGGNGSTSSITGASTYYGGGGGGGVYSTNSATIIGGVAGGLGGGGAGGATNSTTSTAGIAGTNGLGGGGGAGTASSTSAVRQPGGTGGSGLVIVRYIGSSAGTGGTVSAGTNTAAGYTLHSFSASGTLSLNALNVALTGTVGGTGSMVVNGNGGTFTLSNANSYSGTTTLNSGTLIANNTTALGTSALTIANTSGALFQLSAHLTLSSLAGGGTTGGNVNLASYILTTGGDNTSTSFSGVTYGTGTLTKTGTGTLTLAGANTYSGGTNLNAGVLNVNSAGALGSSGTLGFGGGTLQYSANNTTDYSSRVSTAASQAYSLDTNGQNVTWASNLTSLGGTLNKLGAGTLTLSGVNTYAGGNTIAAGTLKLGNAAALGSSSSAVSVANGGVLDINGQTITNTNALTLNGTGISANGALVNSSAAAASFAGAIALASDASAGATTGNITLSGIISGNQSFTKAGTNTLTLTGANTYTGTTTISAGTLQLGNGGTSGSLGSGSIANSGVLMFNRSDSTSFSNLISGTGSVTKLGASTLTLSGASTYAGGTTISGGTLTAGISSSGAVTNGAFGTGLVTVQSGYSLDLNGFSVANALNLSGSGIGNNGALVNSSATAATETGAITMASATSLGGTGAMTLSGAISAGSNVLSFVNGANVTATNTANSIATVSLTNSAAILKTTASLTVNASSLSGATTLQTVGADKDIVVSGAITNNANSNSLTLMASRDINVNANISGASGKSLNTYFYANTDNNGSGGYAQTSAISTWGGSVTIGGGTNDTTTGCAAAYSCIAGYANGNTITSSGTATSTGASITSTASVSAAGGNIAIYGMGNSVASTTGDGIRVFGTNGNSVLSTTGTGTITLSGIATGVWNAIRIGNAGISAGTGLISINGTSNSTSSYSGVRIEDATTITSSGPLTISGTGGSGGAYGVWMYGTAGTGNITVAGDININGQNASRNNGVQLENSRLIQSTTGNITLTGVGTAGIYSTASLVAGNSTTNPTSGGRITVNATGNSGTGFELNTGALVAYGPVSVTTVGSGAHAFYMHGTNAKVSSASDITVSATAGTWGLTMYDNALIQSTGGNINITSNGTAGGLYSNTTGGIVASNNTATPTSATPASGGYLTINATGASSNGIYILNGSLVSYGPMSVTTTSNNNAPGFYFNGSGSMLAVGSLTLSGTANGPNWGIDLENGRVVQSTAGNVSVTGVGDYGIYMNGSIVAGNVASNLTTLTPSAPTVGGTLTLSATGRASYGLQLAAGSFVSNGAMSLTGTGLAEGLYIYGAGGIRSNGNISLNGTATHATSYWGIYLNDSRTIQSTAGNISLTASGAGGIYMNGGGIVAGNDTTTPTSGGTITINSSARGPDIGAAGLRMDGTNTKIIGFGDISIYANGAPSGLNSSGAGHGVLLYGGSQSIRSYGGKLGITGYANHSDGSSNWSANISGGITLYDGSDILRANGDLTLNGVDMQSIGIYLTITSGTGGGVTSDNGNITIKGLSNSGYHATYLRLPITATNGSVYISGAGIGAGIAQDGWYGAVRAKYDINMIGYSTASYGTYLNVGSVISDSGSVYLSGYTSSTNGGYYGIYSNAINATASNGSVTLQGAKINSASTGSGYLVNAAGTLDASNNPAPIFAVADASNMAYAATNGVYWTGGITANASSGYVAINAKAPSITGAMNSYGLALLGNNQNYTLTNAANTFQALAANIGTGSLTVSDGSALTVGSYNGTNGITAGTVTLTAAGLSGTQPITATNASTVTINNTTGSYTYGGVMSGPISVTKSGAGTEVFTGTNAYSGTTTISSGTLQIGNGGTSGTLGSALSNVTNNANLSFNRSDAITYSGVISGTGSVTQQGSGTVTLSGINTYSGATTVSAGTLKLTGKIYCTTQACNVDQNFGAVVTIRSGAVLEITDWSFWGSLGSNYYDNTNIVIDGGTLRYSGSTSTSSGRAYVVTANGATFENTSSGTAMGFVYSAYAGYYPSFGGNIKFTGAGNFAYAQIISGAINLTKEGAGTLVLSNANSYSGGSNLNAGTLQVNSSGALGSAGTISFGGGTLQYSANNTTDYSARASAAANQAYKIDTNGQNVTWASNLTSSGGSLTKLGTGTLTLTGTNTFTGDTTITAGTLQLGNGGTTGSLASTNIVDNATLTLNYGADTTVPNNISGTGGLQVSGGAATLFGAFLTTTPQTIATNNTVAEVLYRLSGGHQSGTAISGAAVSGIYIKNFNPLTNTATFQVQQYELSGGFSYTKTVFVKLTQSGNNVQASIDTGAGHSSGAAYSNNGTNILGTDMSSGYNSMSLATTSSSSGYGVDALYTSGKITLTGSNTYNGSTTLNASTTNVTTGNNQYVQTSLGTLQINGSFTSPVTNNGLIIYNTSTAQSWAASMSGNGYFLKNGVGTLTLTGDATFTGTAVVNTGSLLAGTGGTVGGLGAASNIYLPYAGAANNYAVNRSDNLSMAALVKGVGTFEKMGANTLTLTNSSPNAVFNIDGGTLVMQNDAPSIAGTFNGPGALTIQSASPSFSSAFTFPSLTLGSGANALGGLTLGKTTNITDVTLGSAITTAGPVNVYGGNISVNAAINTSGGGANGDILLKATSAITQASNVSVTTNGGDVTYWADSDSTNGGYVWFKSGSSVNTTSAANITVSGGNVADIATLASSGNATGMTTNNGNGVTLDTVSLYSNGGNISIRGKSATSFTNYVSTDSATSGNANGIRAHGSVTVDTGSGKLSIWGYGQSSTGSSNGIELSMLNTSNSTYKSASTAADAITLYGVAANASASNAWGVYLWNYSSIQATNGGGISLTGSGVLHSGVVVPSGASVLSTGGPITLTGTGFGSGYNAVDIAGSVGLKAGVMTGASASDITLVGDKFSFTGSVAASGVLTLKPYTAGTTIGVGTGTGTWTVANGLFSGTSVFKDGFSSIVIGASNAGNITVGGANTFVDSTTLLTGGNITLSAGATLNDTQSSGYMALAAAGNFINSATGTPLTASGRWLVYSAAPGGDTFGTLNSANSAVWGQSYATQSPSAVTATGNRYVFGNIPSVIVTANNVSKIYGDMTAANSLLGLNTSAIGNSSVFVLPTLSDVFSTAPVAASAGLLSTASVAGGPYSITVTPGISVSGYNVSYAAPGTVTVIPKTLTVTGTTVASKVYDGTTTATLTGGTLAAGGVINGDTVNLVQAGTFASKNVANGIAVTAADTLSGPQASNYSLTQPTGLSANITAKTLTMSGLAANDKVYDGTTTAVVTGTAALTGSVAAGAGTSIDGKWYVGDAVSITGPPAGTFNSKNVAEANSVTFSGLSLSGAQAGNYTLTVQSPATAYITPKTVTLLASKTYDANNSLTGYVTVGNTVTAAGNTEVLSYTAAAANDAHVGTLGKYISAIALADGGTGVTTGLASNYALPALNAANAPVTINAKTLTVSGTSVSSRVYDGTTAATLSGGSIGGGLVGDTLVLTQTGTYASKDVANGIVVTVANSFSVGSTTLGSVPSDYSLPPSLSLTGNITKKALTVTANNDAKFYGLADATPSLSNPTGYYGLVYVGFVSGESASNLTTVPTISRSNSSTQTAGTYSAVLVPAGGSATNYALSYVNGNYTIVPAGQLLVRLANTSTVYGSTPTYTVTEAKYLKSDNTTQVDLLSAAGASVTANNAGQVSVTDTNGTSAIFNATAANGSYSTSGALNVGAYQWGSSNVVLSGATNFSGTVTVVGSETVTVKSITPAPTISKVYDASTSIAALSGTPTGVLTGDVVTLNGSGTYANKNAGTNKTYTLTNLTLTGADAANYSLSTGANMTANNGTISQKALTLSGIAANDKVYDASNTATLNVSNAVFNGMVAGDALSVTASGTFDSIHVARDAGNAVVAQTVRYTNSLGGADASNYSYNTGTQTTSAKITPKPLTFTGVVANDKVYDGSMAATVNTATTIASGTLSGVVGSDAVALDWGHYSASFADKNVTYDSSNAVASKTVTVLASSLGLTGAQASNYQFLVNPIATAKITPKTITSVTGITASDKVYDGTTSASVDVSGATFQGMVANDVLTASATGVFANKTVASGKTVTLTTTFGGADLGNYTLPATAVNPTASITAKALTVSGLLADNRVYDGTSAATVTTSNALLSGLVSGDTVSVSATGTFVNAANVADKNVAYDASNNVTTKTVTLGTLTLSGADANNYSVSNSSQTLSTAKITPKPLTVQGITVNNKVYDNTTTASPSVTAGQSVAALVGGGLVNGDAVTITTSGTFSDENVGTGKTVTLSSSYAGAQLGNYSITSQTTATANITKLDVALSGSSGLTKVYDATTSITPALSGSATGYDALSVAIHASALTADSAINGGLVITGAPVFSNANAGNVTLQQGSVLLTGSRAGNYNLVWTAPTATITPAPLSVIANDDAKFYSQVDNLSTTNYAGVRFSGFVGGQTSAVLGGTLSVTRDRSVQLASDPLSTADQDGAGTYTNVLVPSGLTSSNYNITFTKGNYTIVPAGELLVNEARCDI